MAGSRKGKFFCWADVLTQRCLVVSCQHLNHVVDSPGRCAKCNAPLDYKCRRKLLPDVRCETHRTFAKGPACWVAPETTAQPETLAQQMAKGLPPEARAAFGRFLHETSPADLLRAQAARGAARLQWKSDRGLLSHEEEQAALRTIAYTVDKELRARLISKELNPPKLENTSAYDYSRLTPEKLALLDSLLAEAAIDPAAAAPAALQEARKHLEAPTAQDAWYGSGPVDPPVEAGDAAVRDLPRKRVRKRRGAGRSRSAG